MYDEVQQKLLLDEEL